MCLCSAITEVAVLTSWLFRAAAFLSALGLLAHELLGAPMVLPPLEEVEIPAEILWLHHFSWHVGSVAVAVMASMFLYASFRPCNLVVAAFATAMSIGFACLGIALAMFGNEVLWGTPAPYVWTVIASLAGLGIAAENRTRRHIT